MTLKRFSGKKKYIPYLMLFLIFLFVIYLIFFMPKQSENDIPQAKAGIIDLQNWDLIANKPISLNGEWIIYPQNFVEYDNIDTDLDNKIVEVPNHWNDYMLNDNLGYGQGYATYKLHVKTGLDKEIYLGLKILTFSSAYELYINDEMLASSGKIGTSPDEEIGEYRPQAVFFKMPSREFDILIRVSNYQYARGGFWDPIYLGSADMMTSYYKKAIAYESIIVGALALVSIYFFLNFIVLPKQKYALYFSLLTFVTIINLDLSSEFIVVNGLGFLSFGAMIHIWYASGIYFLFLILYMNELFPSKFSSIVTNVFIGYMILMQLTCFLLPMRVYTRFGGIMNIVEVLGMITVIIIAVMGIWKKKEDSFLNMLSIFIILISYTHDMLYSSDNYIDYNDDFLFVGIFIFLLIQGIIQSRRIMRYYEMQNESELRYLTAQIRPHFLYNSLSAIISISRTDFERTRELLQYFSNYLRFHFQIKNSSQFALLRNELDYVECFIELQKARYDDRFSVEIIKPTELNYKVPVLILQTVVENAIVHGVLPKYDVGYIRIEVKKEGDIIKHIVEDDGIGFNVESFLKGSKDDEGKHVGIYNSNKRLKKLFGTSLDIVSVEGVGTKVSWVVPILSEE